MIHHHGSCLLLSSTAVCGMVRVCVRVCVCVCEMYAMRGVVCVFHGYYIFCILEVTVYIWYLYNIYLIFSKKCYCIIVI